MPCSPTKGHCVFPIPLVGYWGPGSDPVFMRVRGVQASHLSPFVVTPITPFSELMPSPLCALLSALAKGISASLFALQVSHDIGQGT